MSNDCVHVTANVIVDIICVRLQMRHHFGLIWELSINKAECFSYLTVV